MTASILGICRLQINHFVGHKNRRQHCELIIEAKSRLEATQRDSWQVEATRGNLRHKLKGVSSALVPGRKSIDMISGPAYAPLPPYLAKCGAWYRCWPPKYAKQLHRSNVAPSGCLWQHCLPVRH